MRPENRSTRCLSNPAVVMGCFFLLLTAATARAQEEAVGLSSVGARVFFNEDMNGFPAGSGNGFAQAIAAGDFNGDGAEDLATGIPYADGPPPLPGENAGAVVVRWGSIGGGLSTTAPPAHLSLFVAGSPVLPQASENFGYAVAAGDFNGDGRDDLAVGIPGRQMDLGGNPERGAVQIHYGQPGGIQLVGGQFLFSGPTGNVPDPPESLAATVDYLGVSLAAGDFNGDGFDDLAIGATQWNPADPLASGAVVVVHGGASGLMLASGYLIHQSNPAIPDVSEAGDSLGFALASGNFNGDVRCNIDGICRPIDDLAVSALGENGSSGAVLVMRGSVVGLDFGSSQYFGQGQLGGVAEVGDQFGYSLAAGNFDGDCCDDLAVGAPDENLGASNEVLKAGEVTVLFGQPDGSFAGAQLLTQGGIHGHPEDDQPFALFGFSLAAGDFDGDERHDLAVGHPGEDFGGSDRGATTILQGGFAGSGARFRVLTPGVGGIPPDAQDGAWMGFVLATGDFDGNGFSDLAFGLPFQDQGGVSAVGAETILYGALFADGFESEDRRFWSSTTP